MALVGEPPEPVQRDIYNSRNLMALVGDLCAEITIEIYNSRNLMALVGPDDSHSAV